MINGRRYGKHNLHQLPEKLKPLKISTKETPDTIGFFGELCPFSNFYRSELIWNGYIYHSSEQYIQHQKAKFFGDTSTANNIMACKTTLQCKRAARNIENYNRDDWINHAETECIKGLTAKFDQNPKLKSILLNTHNKTLVECSWDNIVGTGCPLTRPDSLDPENWESPGLLGKLLMMVRDELKPSNPALGTIPLIASTDELPCASNPSPETNQMDTDSKANTNDHKN